MREHDRRGHQLGRFIAGITKHQALIAGALFRLLLALRGLGIDTLRNVRGLLGNDGVHKHLVSVEHVVVVHVADFANGVAGDLHEVELGARGDLAADNRDVGLHVGFAGDAAVLVLRKAGVQHGVRNGVSDFVRMAFANGLRGENEFLLMFY